MGIPEPTTLWTFNGKTFMDSAFTNHVSLTLLYVPLHKSHFLISTSYDDQEQAKTGGGIDVVKLSNISPEQGGNYTCEVRNLHGKDWISYDVQVLVPPEQPNVSLLETFHDSLRISWAVGSDGGSRIKGKNFRQASQKLHAKTAKLLSVFLCNMSN